ncbi:MAG TPA: hypothetical protein DE060_16625 [Lentisphaeria bacterium]|nr:hypothetical protein [Lentisphaeria bacterium]HCG50816.1 hypothetical protein [Lentisphaeria bacterium]
MKNDLKSIFDESLGGRPRKAPGTVPPRTVSFRSFFLVCFILAVSAGVSICLWLTWTYDFRETYCAWLILFVFSLTGLTLLFLRR